MIGENVLLNCLYFFCCEVVGNHAFHIHGPLPTSLQLHYGINFCIFELLFSTWVVLRGIGNSLAGSHELLPLPRMELNVLKYMSIFLSYLTSSIDLSYDRGILGNIRHKKLLKFHPANPPKFWNSRHPWKLMGTHQIPGSFELALDALVSSLWIHNSLCCSAVLIGLLIKIVSKKSVVLSVVALLVRWRWC